jgi:hypothetical protein
VTRVNLDGYVSVGRAVHRDHPMSSICMIRSMAVALPVKSWALLPDATGAGKIAWSYTDPLTGASGCYRGAFSSQIFEFITKKDTAQMGCFGRHNTRFVLEVALRTIS